MDETIQLVPVRFEKLIQSRSYTCVVLGAKEKRFAIYMDPTSGKAMQLHLAATEKSRPYTHDLLNLIFAGLEIKVKQIIIYDLQGTLYFARIFLEQQKGDLLHIVEIDARPSDGITLALLHKVPIYCSQAVLDKTIPYAE